MLKNLLYIISLFLILSLISSCAKLPIYKSKSNDKFNVESGFSGYDKKSSVRWLITNDEENLYLRLETADKLTSMKIIKTGLTLYIDTIGKKKKGMYIEFPLPGRSTDFKQGGNSSNGNKNPKGIQPKFSEEDILDKMPRQALFHSNSEIISFNYLVEKNEFDIDLRFSNTGDLVYSIKIPFEKIKSGGLSDLNRLSIGFVSGAFKAAGGNMNNMQKQGRGSNKGGMKGGGGKGGGKGNKSGSMQSSLITHPVKIWFEVDLYR